MCVCVVVCISVCVCIYIYMCVCVHIYTNKHTHTHIYKRMHNVYILKHTHTHTHTHTSKHTHTHSYIYIYIYIYNLLSQLSSRRKRCWPWKTFFRKSIQIWIFNGSHIRWSVQETVYPVIQRRLARRGTRWGERMVGIVFAISFDCNRFQFKFSILFLVF